MSAQHVAASPYPDDLALRDALLRREPRAWPEFDRRYDRLVRSCIERVLRRFPRHVGLDEIEDVRGQFVLDLTARDMHRLRAFSPDRGSKLGTFVGMIATNTAWDHVRGATRRRARTVDISAIEVPGDAPDPFEQTERRERCHRLGRAIDALSERDRDFVRLYFVDGLEPEEVAAAMAISVKTVYSKTHKLRARLSRFAA